MFLSFQKNCIRDDTSSFVYLKTGATTATTHGPTPKVISDPKPTKINCEMCAVWPKRSYLCTTHMGLFKLMEKEDLFRRIEN